MGTLNDLSQLKHFKPAEPAPAEPARPTPPEDRALAGASSSSDYFSALLGGNEKGNGNRSPAKPRRTTVVTPATVARVREEQAEEARAAEHAAFAARESMLLEELEAQKVACESLAADLTALRLERDAEGADLAMLRDRAAKLEEELTSLVNEKRTLEDEKRALEEALAAERAQPRLDESLVREAADKDREITRLGALLAEAQRTSLSSSVLLDKPAGFAEKFPGEIREHVIETLVAANDAAEAGGRDRRARILEAVLGSNPPTGELERRRETIRQIMKDAGTKIDGAALAELGKLGFRVISGKNHHKLEWAGIRFPLAKTPSDYRACLNSAAEIANRIL